MILEVDIALQMQLFQDIEHIVHQRTGEAISVMFINEKNVFLIQKKNSIIK